MVKIGGEMKAPGGKFGRKKEEAIAALLTQRNIEEAAKAVGIGANTLLRWLKVPEFEAAYREARRAAFRQSVARLQQASGAAVSTLLKIMVDTGAPHSTRVRAADSVLDHSAKAIEIEDIEARVSELERAAEQVKQCVPRWPVGEVIPECRTYGSEWNGWRDSWRRSLLLTHTTPLSAWRCKAFQRKIQQCSQK
jgi:transposase-like protein